MALSNAERQKRYRERLKVVARNSDAGGLTPEQRADRDAVMADPIYPVPKDTSQIPRFLGWHRYEWAEAPVELIDHFGMRSVWEGWQAEKQALRDELDEPHHRHDAYIAKIIAEHGKEVCERAKEGMGVYRLLSNYRQDSTLARFKKRGRNDSVGT